MTKLDIPDELIVPHRREEYDVHIAELSFLTLRADTGAGRDLLSQSGRYAATAPDLNPSPGILISR